MVLQINCLQQPGSSTQSTAPRDHNASALHILSIFPLTCRMFWAIWHCAFLGLHYVEYVEGWVAIPWNQCSVAEHYFHVLSPGTCEVKISASKQTCFRCSISVLYFLARFGAGLVAASFGAGFFFGVGAGGSHAALGLGAALAFRAATFGAAFGFGITVLRSQQDAIVCGPKNRLTYNLDGPEMDGM